ncbi:hypothetical protein KIPB_012316, partial [Kipferlia bialata]|eukprot:g12316.t1
MRHLFASVCLCLCMCVCGVLAMEYDLSLMGLAASPAAMQF